MITAYEQRHPLAFWFFAKAFGYPLGGTEAARPFFCGHASSSGGKR